VPARRINEIVHGKRRVSGDTALRLARFFGTSERFWINLQSGYDLEVEKDRLGDAPEGSGRSGRRADRLAVSVLSWSQHGGRSPRQLLSV
jgi:antitoxin HigA-1